MLGLGQQVDGDPGGVLGGVGHHQDLRRSGDHVDADGAEHLALGGGDVDVAGADDLIDRGDGFGAERQGGDRLGAADPVDLGDTGEVRRRQHQRVDHPCRRRHRHDDALDTGDAGGQRVHQHARGIGGQATRHVNADGGDGAKAGSKGHTGAVHIGRILWQLTAVIVLDPVGGELQRRQRLGIHRPCRRLDLGHRHGQGLGRQLGIIEALGIIDDRLIAARAHVGEDFGDGGIDLRLRFALARHQLGERRLETGVSGR